MQILAQRDVLVKRVKVQTNIKLENNDHDERQKYMIYTVTFNPSLDYIVSVKDFALGKTNRTTDEQMLAGGKGINVSTV